MRLIDADALIEELRGRLMKEVYPDWDYLPSPTKNRIGKLGEAFKLAIEQAPTIEAEPVVMNKTKKDKVCPATKLPCCECVPGSPCAKTDGGNE